MKKRSILKSIVTSVVAFAVVVTTVMSAVPTYAAADTITIKAGDQSGIGEADRFTAYQIFKGTPKREGSSPTDLEYQLNVTDWGSDVNGDDLYTAVTESSVFQTAFNDWNTSATTGNKADEFTKPAALAEFLASDEFKAIADGGDEFAKLVFANKQGNGTSSTRPGGGTGDWSIKVPADGYYLVVDTYASGGAKPDGSVSSYILQVIGEVEVDLKATISTVEKKVENHMGFLSGGEKVINYTLTGTLPMNYDTYDKFEYKFTDTLSTGLTANDSSVAVNLVNSGSSTAFTKTTDYTVNLAAAGGSGNTLTISFTDLKKSSLAAQIKPSSKIVVTYTAKLNKDAVVSNAGNKNSVTLTYSNDPYGSGTGESVPAEVKTYTIGLDVTKTEEGGSPLDGAQFKLSKEDGGIKWAKIENNLVTSWVTSEGDATAITTSSGKFNVKGLDVGTYTLRETTTPDGYETMKDVVFTITASVTSPETSSNSINVTTPDNTREDVTFSAYGTNGLPITLVNYKSPILPHTGGIGRAIVIGVSTLVVLFGCAVVLFSVRKKNNK